MLFLSFSNSYSQQYGWTNIGGNLPSSNGTASLSDLYFISDTEGWICSSGAGEIYHTADGGNTFTTQTTQYYTNAIHMLNSSEGYAGGYNGRVYRTTDGGATWNVIGSIGSSVLSISFPPSSTTGYCCGDNGKIYSINSSGVSAMTSGVISSLRSISFPSSGLGWTCGSSLILNYSGSWSQQDPPSESYNGIYMINSTTGWAVGALGVIVKTTDGGLSWDYQSNPDTSTRALNDVFFLNASEGWAVGNRGVILHTTNGGSAWSIEGSGLTTNMLRSVQFTSSSNGYILGNNGTLLKYSQLTGIENVEEKNRNTKLVQNYPNPFNSATLLKYTLHQRGNVHLAVYNQQGQVISLLVNEYQSAGEHTATFDGIDLPSGVYFYRINIADKFEAGKMMLIK
ncbi:MAG: T9SS type A sorting domain-containing protein [Bacteroidia bacterium]|nr:T9SS type A sorting domain-containing protein [Bacteroidia bacterium]